MNPPRIFKTGLVVEDLASACDDLSRWLGVAWTPVQEADLVLRTANGLEEVRLAFVYSTGEAPHLELLQAQPSGFYEAKGGSFIHHVGIWVSDLEASSERYSALGLQREAAGVNGDVEPYSFAFHNNPHGLRLELVDDANREMFEAWLAGGELTIQ